MISSILLPALFTMKVGGLLLLLRSNIRAMERMRRKRTSS